MYVFYTNNYDYRLTFVCRSSIVIVFSFSRSFPKFVRRFSLVNTDRYVSFVVRERS